MAYSLTQTLTENPFCVRQLEAEDFIDGITA